MELCRQTASGAPPWSDLESLLEGVPRGARITKPSSITSSSLNAPEISAKIRFRAPCFARMIKAVVTGGMWADLVMVRIPNSIDIALKEWGAILDSTVDDAIPIPRKGYVVTALERLGDDLAELINTGEMLALYLSTAEHDAAIMEHNVAESCNPKPDIDVRAMRNLREAGENPLRQRKRAIEEFST